MQKGFYKGFTLVEVLAAMAIFTTVAALVLPSLYSGAQNRRLAGSLGRSVETIETGCQVLIQDMNSQQKDGEFFGHYTIHKDMDGKSALNGMNDSIVTKSNLFNLAARYFDVTPLTAAETNAYTASVHSFNGGNPSPSVSDIAINFAKHSKWGAYYGVRFVKVGFMRPFGGYELIYIDVNGENTPNKYGRDIFLFELDDSCHMIPAGSQRLATRTNNAVPLEARGCSGNANSIINGLSCTSRVIRDGYKMEY